MKSEDCSVVRPTSKVQIILYKDRHRGLLRVKVEAIQLYGAFLEVELPNSVRRYKKSKNQIQYRKWGIVEKHHIVEKELGVNELPHS